MKKVFIIIVLLFLTEETFSFQVPLNLFPEPWRMYVMTGVGFGAGDYDALSRWTDEHNKAYHTAVKAGDSDGRYTGSYLSHSKQPDCCVAMDYSAELKLFYRNMGAGFAFSRGGFSSGENSFIIQDTGDTINILRNKFIIYSYVLSFNYRYPFREGRGPCLLASMGLGFHYGTYTYSIVNAKYTGIPPYESLYEAIYKGYGVSGVVTVGGGYDFNLIAVESFIRLRTGSINEMSDHSKRMRYANGEPVHVSLNSIEVVCNVGVRL